MTCFLVCMLLALALRSITCQEVRGYRTSPNEALKDVWPHDRCDQPRVSVQRSFSLVQPHNVPGESNGAHASPSHTCQAMGALHPAVFKDYRRARLYRSPSVVRKLAQSSRRQGNDDGLPTLQPDRITQAPRVTPACLEVCGDRTSRRQEPIEVRPSVRRCRSLFASQAQQDICTGGSVDTTPERSVAGCVTSHARILSAWEDWSVVTTPEDAARATESGALYPGKFEWSFTSQAVLQFSLQGTHGSGSVGEAPHPSVPDSERGKLHLCSTVLAAWNIPDPSAAADSVLAAPHSSSSAPQPVGPGKATSIMSVTALLQRMTDWVCSDAPLPDHSLWAPVFYDLDQAWASTHDQTLSTPQFVQALTTYILIKEQVAPSSDTAVHIKEVVNSVAKVRIKLLHARGDTNGMTPAGSEPEPQGIGTSAATSADQLSPAERLSLLSEVLTDMETAYQDRVNRLHEDLADCMEDKQRNLIELLEKFLHSAGTLSTDHLRDLYSHLSVCLAQTPPRMQGAHLRRALESRLREGGLSDDWIRSRFKGVADRVTGVVRATACNHTASRAQARESVLPSGGLSRCSTKGGHQHGSTYVCLQVTSEKCKRWFAVFRAAGCPSTKYAALCLEKRVHCGPTRDGQEPQTSTINRAPVINHAQQVQKAKFGYSSPGQTISKALLRNRTKKARHIAGHQLALTSCCQRSKCKDLCMMRPPPSFKVIGQPSQTSWPRPGERTANAGTLCGSPFPPDWRQIVLGQVHTAAPPCSTLPTRDAKASHLHSDLEQELSSTVFKHVRVPSLRPCTWPRDCTHNQRLPAYTGAITSQKLFVDFHTAYPRGDSAKEAMPSPSAKLKSSRRLPKHLRVSGTPPSGAIAQAREEAEARYNRGESNRRGQHSSVQGRRTGAETGDQWQARTWQSGWYASYQQESWYADSSCSSADPWHEWPSAADPTSRWRPRVEVSPRQKEAGANETQEGWNGIDPVATTCRMEATSDRAHYRGKNTPAAAWPTGHADANATTEQGARP